MHDRPVLSIAIPTYNRAGYLFEALQALIAQLDETVSTLVEIIISDNASTDHTQALVQGMQTDYPQIQVTYFRQAETVNGNANIHNAAKLARGTFVYILSDDDVLLPGALPRLLSEVDTDPMLDAVCLNLRSFALTPSEVTPPVFRMAGDLTTSDSDEALVQTGTFLTFISAMAFRRELVDFNDYTCRINTALPHTYLFLDVLARMRTLLITSTPFLAVRANNSGGYNFFEVFVTNFHQALKYAEEIGFSASATKKVMSQHLVQHIGRSVYAFKNYGAIGQLKPDYADGARRMLRVYWGNPFFWLGVMPLMLLPSQYARFMRRLWKQAKSLRGRSTANIAMKSPREGRSNS